MQRNTQKSSPNGA